MALSNPRPIFGVHSVTPYSRTDGTFYGTIKVVKGSSMNLQGTPVELTGGAQKFPFAIEDGAIKAEMALKFAQYEDFMFTLFLGIAPTPVSAETGGNATGFANVKGTSCFKATTGIATVTVKSGSEADLKFGRYIVKAVSATTVDVYCASDVDFGRGTAGSFQNDVLKITASALSITTTTAVTIPSFGLELTGGSGSIGMTTGDTAEFLVRPINTGGSVVSIGAAASQTMPEFGCIAIAQKQGSGALVEVDCFRCKATGMPIQFEEKKFSEADVKVNAFYDSAKDKVFDYRYVIAP